MKNKVFFIIFLCFILSQVQGNEFLFLGSALLTMETAGEPALSHDNVILTFWQSSPVRYVGARFAHEQFRKLHVFQKNDNRVFFLIVPLPENGSDLKYRIVVDGLWMRDPNNPQFVSERGIEYSIYSRGRTPLPEAAGPQLIDDRRVRFTYQSEPGQIIYLVGSFNHWDPFALPLREEAGGLYSANLSIGPGTHYYAFIVGGDQVGDPENPNRTVDKNGKIICLLWIPP